MLIWGWSGIQGLIERVVDSTFTGVFVAPVTQIAIQDSDRAWATDGDSLYTGTNAWHNWQTTFVDSVLTGAPLTLVKATPTTLFIYSHRVLYWTTTGDTLIPANGIFYDDSITAMDYVSDSLLIAVSSNYIFRSTDGGKNWTDVYSTMKGCASVFVDTAHHLIFTGGDNLRESTDSGMTWNIIVPPAEFDYTNFGGQVFGARDCSGAFYISTGSTNGSNLDIMRSQDGGNTFESAGQNPIPSFQGITDKAWVFDRGSTIYWGSMNYPSGLDISITHNGADGLISDSVASAISVAADTIFDTLCSSGFMPLDLSVSSSICTGVRIDSISIVHASGKINVAIVPHTLFGNQTTFTLSYSATNLGFDSIMLRILMHSLEWGFKEHVDVSIPAYVVSSPPELVSSDSLQFGNVKLGMQARHSLLISNSGCSSLRIDSLVSSNSTVFAVPSLSFPVYLAGDSTAKIPITFSPARAGDALESLELGTNAGHTFIELEGTGVASVSVVDMDGANPEVFAVFPNPANTMLYLSGVEEGTYYTLFDLLGRSVQTGFVSSPMISVASLTEGTYVLKCGSHTERIIISRQ